MLLELASREVDVVDNKAEVVVELDEELMLSRNVRLSMVAVACAMNIIHLSSTRRHMLAPGSPTVPSGGQ